MRKSEDVSDGDLALAIGGVGGFICAALIFGINDPNVSAIEIETAKEVCANHNGISYMKPTLYPNMAAGKCNDGMVFKTSIKVK